MPEDEILRFLSDVAVVGIDLVLDDGSTVRYVPEVTTDV